VIFFTDTCELIPGKLAALAKEFDVADRKIDFDVKTITDKDLENEKFKADLIKYCHMDVTVMR